MKLSIRLAACLVVALCSEHVIAQSTSNEANSDATTAAPVAYVYAQTTKGVSVYDVAATGKLTLVKGSPFKTLGEMIGSNGKYFITLGINLVHSYPIGSNGAIGKQVSEINTLDFDGVPCGYKEPGTGTFDSNGGFLDPSGQNVYVMIGWPQTGACVAYQTFNIDNASGTLTFNGALVHNTNPGWSVVGMPTLTANERFAYDDMGQNGIAKGVPLTGFTRGSDGVLQSVNFLETDPPPMPGYVWAFYLVAADPANHLAVNVVGVGPSTGPEQLASYTVGSDGNIVSTNTYEDMPISDVSPTVMKISPSGNLLALGGCTPGNEGLQVFHFNGAKPITHYSGLLSNDCFGDYADLDALQWDNNNHLYAYSLSAQHLFVYTVTPTSITEAPGSPYSLLGNGSNSLVVVPK